MYQPTRFGVRVCLFVVWCKHFQPPLYSLRKFKIFHCKMQFFVKSPICCSRSSTIIFKNKFSYISVIDEASDLKFGKPLGLTKVHHKIIKSGRGPRLGELPKLLRFLFCISATARLATSNLVCSLGSPRAIIKSYQ